MPEKTSFKKQSYQSEEEKQALSPKSSAASRTTAFTSPVASPTGKSPGGRLSSFSDRLTSILSSFFIFLKFPWYVWCILGSEASERFAFYGFKSVLPLYLKDYLLWGEDQATVIVHAFIFLACFTPIIGSIIADGYLGKFATVVILSLVYCFGQTFIAVTAIPGVTGNPPQSWGIFIGLVLVALGSGGIKSNISAFAAEQFPSDNPALITSFFSFFYLAINLGSTASTIITPVLRTYVGYDLAFALPALFMFIATTIFVVGRFKYRVVKPKENIILEAIKVTIYTVYANIRDAIKFCLRMNRKRVSHFLDRAKDRYDDKLVEDIKICFRIMVVLAPTSLFWSLYDQHASRFVFQAEKMNRNFFGVHVDADQIQIINPLLILIMVPIFDRVIYPLLRACPSFVELTALKRIGAGFVFTAASFVLSALIDALVESVGDGKIHVIAQVPQYIILGAGEILTSITALEFAYQQAPPRMKSVMSAYYLLTVSVGNMIVIVVASLPIPNFSYKQTIEFLVFAFLIMLAFGLFVLLAKLYKYRDSTRDDEEIASYSNMKNLPANDKESLDELAFEDDNISLSSMKKYDENAV